MRTTISATKPPAIGDPNYLALVKHYKRHPIVLFTGAGVSWSRSDEYGLGGWNGFVRRVLEEQTGSDTRVLKEFDRRVAREWADEPWKMADWVVERCGRDEFQEQVAAIIEQVIRTSVNKYVDLVPKFLNFAPTLRAVSAFCARFVDAVRVWEPTGLGGYGIGSGIQYRARSNPRVAAVVTSNYDPFLEYASHTMFGAPRLLNSLAAGGAGLRVPSISFPEVDRIPVFHIHGYMSYPDEGFLPFLPEKLRREVPDEVVAAMTKQSIDMPDFVHPVLTTSDYDASWRLDDPYCATMGALIHYLRYYSALFVGFSFRDRWISHLLMQLNDERGQQSARPYHYALIRQGELHAEREAFLAQLGVKPVALKDYSEIPGLLGDLYQGGLVADYEGLGIAWDVRLGHAEAWCELPILKKRPIGRFRKREARQHLHLSQSQYWEDLFWCFEGRVERPNVMDDVR